MSESFIQYFNRTVAKVRVRKKSSSQFMRSIAWMLALLTRLRVVDFPVRKFMRDYTTTIRYTIYSNRMDVNTEPNTLVVHELAHVMQWHRGKMKFMFRYLLNKKRRAFYEAEAHQAAMLFDDKRWSDDKLKRVATKLKSYGCDYKTSLSYLESMREQAGKGNPREIPRVIDRALKEWESA